MSKDLVQTPSEQAENSSGHQKSEPVEPTAGMQNVIDAARRVNAASSRELSAAFTRITELETALEPFSNVAGEGDEDFPDDAPVIVKFGRTTCYSLCLGDLRRAHIAASNASDDRAVITSCI
jgi:hypothetical protein